MSFLPRLTLAFSLLSLDEMPSGGDWSLHRGGAVYLENAVDVGFSGMSFDQVGGNGLVMSDYVRNCSVRASTFWRTGDSAVIMVGSTQGNNGTAETFPAFNALSSLWIDTVGVAMKQTSCVFNGVTFANNVTDTVCYNGPRAGLNWNDGFMGAHHVSGNLVFNMVRESGDHGTWNSWSRKEWFYLCPGSMGFAPGSLCMMPQTINVHNNLFLGPAGWNMDHDDGSSHYHDYDNPVYLGGFKYRDGVLRNMTGNVMLGGTKPAQGAWFQACGFPEDFFDNNYVAAPKGTMCGPPTIGSINGTIYLQLPAATSAAAEEDVHPTSDTSRAASSDDGNGCDQGTVQNMTYAQLEDLIWRQVLTQK